MVSHLFSIEGITTIRPTLSPCITKAVVHRSDPHPILFTQLNVCIIFLVTFLKDLAYELSIESESDSVRRAFLQNPQGTGNSMSFKESINFTVENIDQPLNKSWTIIFPVQLLVFHVSLVLHVYPIDWAFSSFKLCGYFLVKYQYTLNPFHNSNFG